VESAGEVDVKGARGMVWADRARGGARGLGMGGSGETFHDVGAVERASASSSGSEKGELGKTFERKMAQRSGRWCLNLINFTTKPETRTMTATFHVLVFNDVLRKYLYPVSIIHVVLGISLFFFCTQMIFRSIESAYKLPG